MHSPLFGRHRDIIYRVFFTLCTANKAFILRGRPLTNWFLEVLCKKIYHCSNRELKCSFINKHAVTKQTSLR